MMTRVREMHQLTGQRVALVGWSLGGFAARELSRIPGVPVRKVITLGTPFSAGHATSCGGTSEMLSGVPASHRQEQGKKLADEPPVPGASIYSLTDGVVGWKACIQAHPRRTRNIKVLGTSHFGLVLCPHVLFEVLAELAG